jgi:hypothetical protein
MRDIPYIEDRAGGIHWAIQERVRGASGVQGLILGDDKNQPCSN